MTTTIERVLADRCQSVLADAYETKKLFGRSGAPIEVFPTGMTRDSGDTLTELIANEGAANFLEVGLGLGLSTVFLSLGILRHRESFDALTLDPFQESHWDSVGLEMIRRAGLSDRVKFEKQYSEYVLPRLAEAGTRFDFIFVDGGHLFDNAFVDTFFAVRLARPGSLIVLDDRWMPAIQKTAAFFTGNIGLIDESAPKGTPGHRFISLRVPREMKVRKWDHFADF
ncbi:MAG: class I SAM-dependent methyltransferase [Phycisphaeraceae bacterium]|nr:class I SAM-dependent methyltransferase [Phycisphaeraceae bacterium]